MVNEAQVEDQKQVEPAARENKEPGRMREMERHKL